MVRMPLWIAMALVGVTLAMGGCGSSDGGGGGGGGLTEPLPSETREQEKISGPSAPIWHFLERNYGSEDWFDNVREISFIDGYTLARLTALKNVHDPENFFHLNQNIPPSQTGDAPQG